MFISPAWADTAAATAATVEPTGSIGMSMMPILLLFVVFYLLVIRPQSKRIREHQEMVNALKIGDKVVTGGGLHAKVVKIEERDITVEIAPGVNVKAQKHTVTALVDPIVANDTVQNAKDKNTKDKK